MTVALQHMEVLCYNGLKFEFIKVCMGVQQFCWKSQFCLYFVNKIYLIPCCCVVFFGVRRVISHVSSGSVLLLANSICPMSRFAERSHKGKKKQYNSSYCELGPPVPCKVVFLSKNSRKSMMMSGYLNQNFWSNGN